MDVTDNPGKHRFEVKDGDQVAGFAAYTTGPGRITFTHTEVDPAHKGKGVGGQLVRAALDTARERGLAVLPECPFVRGWIAKHPDYVDLVPESRRADYDL
ncbi:GNAT family N-acetyltransferase [Fodinicola acaciae]|uniref:GNAT family N-acetyltransferase n=1 Tax=Fodinicola acaciae TaxID=2681555 RepID=UPI0013D3CF60|nr:GNAT family N-acetyltransferase [Fodinicola acaciae]